MRICCVNVKYSPNLGDGILVECLEAMIKKQFHDASLVFSIDLAARKQYGAGGGARGLILRVLDRMPEIIRRGFLYCILKYYSAIKWRPYYLECLKGSDMIVIGGGNLFSDMDWNFPTKLRIVFDLAAAMKIPVCIYGVGVSSSWTARGARMVFEGMAEVQLKSIHVRDRSSKRNFDNQFNIDDGFDVRIVRDPGLYVSRLYPAEVPVECREIIGVCVTSALAVRYHSKIEISDEYLLDWYVGVINNIIRSGRKVYIFTNGSSEDVECSKQLLSKISIKDEKYKICLQPGNPEELCRVISSCCLVIAFRMHALIAAYSYGSKILALKWDSKVDAFMSSVGLVDNLISVVDVSPENAYSLIQKISDQSYDENYHSEVIDDSIFGIDLMMRSVESSGP